MDELHKFSQCFVLVLPIYVDETKIATKFFFTLDKIQWTMATKFFPRLTFVCNILYIVQFIDRTNIDKQIFDG